jgi:hypothetical protein
MDWIELADDKKQLASSCGHGDELSGSIKCDFVFFRIEDLLPSQGLCFHGVGWLVS